jgi:hypothetical protein
MTNTTLVGIMAVGLAMGVFANGAAADDDDDEAVTFVVAKKQPFHYTDVEHERRSLFKWKIPPAPGGAKYTSGTLSVYGSVSATPRDGEGDVEMIVSLSGASYDPPIQRRITLDGNASDKYFSFQFPAKWNSEYTIVIESAQRHSHRLKGTISGVMGSP